MDNSILNSAILNSRISKAAEFLSTPSNPKEKTANISKEDIAKDLVNLLSNLGVGDSELGLKVLNTETTVFEDFLEATKKEQASDSISFARIPKPKLKVVWSYLKGDDPFENLEEKDSNDYSKMVNKPIGQWTDLELLEAYGKGCPMDIEEELKKRTHDRSCIIFDSAENVDQEKSLYLVRQARHQDTPSTFEIRGEICETYRIGEFPLDIFYECPIHSHTLLVDGYCDECGKRWDIKEYDKNVFLRLIVENESIDIRPYKAKSFDELKSDFPKIFLKYKGLKDEGKLPSLKRKLSSSKESDPFKVVTVHKTY